MIKTYGLPKSYDKPKPSDWKKEIRQLQLESFMGRRRVKPTESNKTKGDEGTL